MSKIDSAGRGAGSQQGPWVYFIESTGSGRIKIGVTAGDVEDRRRALQTGSSEVLRVLAMVQGDEKLERRLHMRFASDRVVGEWFAPSASLVAFVDGIHLAQEQHVTGHETRAQAEDAKRRAARAAGERIMAELAAEKAAKSAAREAEADAARTPEERARWATLTDDERVQEELDDALRKLSSVIPGQPARRPR